MAKSASFIKLCSSGKQVQVASLRQASGLFVGQWGRADVGLVVGPVVTGASDTGNENNGEQAEFFHVGNPIAETSMTGDGPAPAGFRVVTTGIDD